MKTFDGCGDADLEKMCNGHVQMHAKGATFQGLYPSSMGSIFYNCQGNRVFATMRITEAYTATGLDTFQGVVTRVSRMESGEELEIPSLRNGYLSAGDILFIPPGHLCFERAVNGHNVGCRVLCPVFDKSALDDLRMVNATFPRKLELVQLVFILCFSFGCRCTLAHFLEFSALPKLGKC